MKGFCFLGEPEGKDGKRHLKIILTDPNGEGLVAVVSVTTLTPAKLRGAHCILRKGDHPFIRHDSIVNFRFAEVRDSRDILARRFRGELELMESLEPAVLERVLAAARLAPKMQRKIREFLKA